MQPPSLAVFRHQGRPGLPAGETRLPAEVLGAQAARGIEGVRGGGNGLAKYLGNIRVLACGLNVHLVVPLFQEVIVVWQEARGISLEKFPGWRPGPARVNTHRWSGVLWQTGGKHPASGVVCQLRVIHLEHSDVAALPRPLGQAVVRVPSHLHHWQQDVVLLLVTAAACLPLPTQNLQPVYWNTRHLSPFPALLVAGAALPAQGAAAAAR